MDNTKEIEIQVVSYDVNQITTAINLLENITVSGIEACKSITNIYEILNNPVKINPEDLVRANNNNDAEVISAPPEVVSGLGSMMEIQQ